MRATGPDLLTKAKELMLAGDIDSAAKTIDACRKEWQDDILHLGQGLVLMRMLADILHINVEEGNYYECQICNGKGEAISNVAHEPTCWLGQRIEAK